MERFAALIPPQLAAGFAVEGLLAAGRGVARAAASKASRAWAACIRRIFEVDPVLCDTRAQRGESFRRGAGAR